MHRKTGAERAVAIITAFAVLSPATPFAALAVAWSRAQAKPPAAGAPAKPPATTAATAPAPNGQAGAKPSAAASDAPPIDGGWPRMYDLASGGSLLVYQPQVSTWKDQKHMVAFSAVSYRDKAADKPAYGTLRMEADTSVSLTDRLVSFKNLRIAEATFQTLSKEQVREVVATIEKVMSPDERVIALDRVLANIDKSQIVPKNVEGIKADPPPIFFSTHARCDREHRRPSDLEPDQGQRPEVRGQHELGPVPARAEQDVLPPQRQQLAQSHRRCRSVGTRGHAPRQLQEAAG